MDFLSRISLQLDPERETTNRIVEIGGVQLDLNRMLVVLEDGNHALLLGSEMLLFAALIRRWGQIAHYSELVDILWGDEDYASTNRIKCRVSALRRKLGPSGQRIQATRGVGYSWDLSTENNTFCSACANGVGVADSRLANE